jgi:hypothetical protein
MRSSVIDLLALGSPAVTQDDVHELLDVIGIEAMVEGIVSELPEELGFTLVRVERHPGFHLEGSNGEGDLLSLGDEVEQAVIDLIDPDTEGSDAVV